MGIIDDIKAKLDIVDEIGASVKLKRAGKNYSGLCPFHNEKTPSFIVFPGTQSWKCFGQCNQGGDLLDFVMKKEGWSLEETMRTLAAKAGVEMRPQTPEEKQKADLRREREAVFGAAAQFFRRQLGAPANFPLPKDAASPGLEYAVYTRGWSLETLRQAQVGYFGKDWKGLKEYLEGAGIDLTCPPAVALIGFRGDVDSWGRKHGVPVAKGWVEDEKIPAMPPDMLIYVHHMHGRVSYLTGRHLQEGDGPKSWNPPSELVGEKQPYFNHVWFGDRSAKWYVIVEGQADALTLGQWNIPAAALVGNAISGEQADGKKTKADNVLLAELKRKVQGGTKAIVGLDNDDGGHAQEPNVIADLLAGGFNCLQVESVDWPEKDVNYWLAEAGGTAEAAVRELNGAEPALEDLVQEAAPVSGKNNDEALRTLFAELARLSTFEVERVREDVCARINMRRRVFDGLLKAARRDAGQGEDGQPMYFVEAGRIMARYFDSRGGETVEALCNFSAEIKGDVLRDNGQDVIREFHIKGAIGKYHLPTAQVKADDFSKMDWVLSSWGSRAIIEAGSRRRDQLRAAIQHLSKGVDRMTIYTHTGWREIENGQGPKRIYLTTAGAVGGEQVQVELDKDLELYHIPPLPENPVDAMRLSMEFLTVAPARITFPIWGAMFLPPLRDLVNVAFALWVYGGSGAMKSTLIALAMNHYGPSFDDKHLPASFLDSANRLEQKSFVVKDAPLVVDDYAPQKDSNSARAYIQSAHRIVRAAGNLTGRGRLNADSTAKTTYDPRSLIIITGEDLPESESLVARMFVLEMFKGDVDKKRLSDLQAQRSRLSHAMSGYLTWAAESWKGWEQTIPQRWREYRQKGFEAGYHLRLPEAVAGLMLGIEMGLRYAQTVGVISSGEFASLLADGWAALREGAASMSDRVKEEKPEILFRRTLSDLITQGKVMLRAADGLNPKVLGGSEHGTELLGWYDKDWLYLLPDATYNRIARHFRDQGNIFPVREQTLRKALAEANVIEVEKKIQEVEKEDGELDIKTETRRTLVRTLDGQPRRVMVLRRNWLEEQEEAGK